MLYRKNVSLSGKLWFGQQDDQTPSKLNEEQKINCTILIILF